LPLPEAKDTAEIIDLEIKPIDEKKTTKRKAATKKKAKTAATKKKKTATIDTVDEPTTEEKGDSKKEILPEGPSLLKKTAPLAELGMQPSVTKKFTNAGINNTGVLAVMSIKQVADIVAGVGEMTARKWVSAARDYHGLGLKKASALDKEQRSRKKITTGLDGLDRLLGGGIETGVITEFYGAFKSGKTQLCHQLSVIVQLPENKGGLDKNCAWIDTEGTWYAQRPKAIAERFGLDSNKVLDRIFIARSYNSEEQIAMTNEIVEKIDEYNIGLIIIDSLIAHFRGEYIGRGTLATRQQTISNYLEMLARPISVAGVAVVVTNQVSANPDPYAVGGPERAVGGHVVAHSTTHRIHFKGKSKSVTASIIDSPILKPDKCDFAIMDDGLHDLK